MFTGQRLSDRPIRRELAFSRSQRRQRPTRAAVFPAALVLLLSFAPAAAPQARGGTLLHSIRLEPDLGSLTVTSDEQTFAVTAPQSVDSIFVIPHAASHQVRLWINGVPFTCGRQVSPVALQYGRNLIIVRAACPSEGGQATILLRVTRNVPTVTWVRAACRAPWSPRDSHALFALGDRLVLCGGRSRGFLHDVWTSTDGVNWSPSGEVPDSTGIALPVGFSCGGRVWTTGMDGCLFSTEHGDSWSEASAATPLSGRYAAGHATFRGEMWAMGGTMGAVFHDVWSTGNGLDWTCRTAEAPWSPRSLFGMVATQNDRLWVLGGGICLDQPFEAYNDIWSSADGSHWELVNHEAEWPPRTWGVAAAYRDRLWILGGFRVQGAPENLNDVWYSPDGSEWKRLLTDAVWSPRRAHAAVVFQGRLWVMGGDDGSPRGDIWHLDGAGLTFLTQPVLDAVAGREYRYASRADFGAPGRAVSYRMLSGPSWLRIDPQTGLLSGRAEEAQSCEVRLEAYDGAGGNARQAYTLYVEPDPRDPYRSLSPEPEAGSDGAALRPESAADFDVRASEPGLIYPNPFAAPSSLKLRSTCATTARIEAFDAAGRSRGLIWMGRLPAGGIEVAWDGRTLQGARLSRGLYFLYLRADGRDHSYRLLLVR